LNNIFKYVLFMKIKFLSNQIIIYKELNKIINLNYLIILLNSEIKKIFFKKKTMKKKI